MLMVYTTINRNFQYCRVWRGLGGFDAGGRDYVEYPNMPSSMDSGAVITLSLVMNLPRACNYPMIRSLGLGYSNYGTGFG